MSAVVTAHIFNSGLVSCQYGVRVTGCTPTIEGLHLAMLAPFQSAKFILELPINAAQRSNTTCIGREHSVKMFYFIQSSVLNVPRNCLAITSPAFPYSSFPDGLRASFRSTQIHGACTTDSFIQDFILICMVICVDCH